MKTDRLQQQLRFLAEIDQLKSVLRRTTLIDKSRLENSAEHSWHVALMALVLAEHRDTEDLDFLRVVKMLLIHDIVEVDAGDTFCYDIEANRDKLQRECEAADRIFRLLPDDVGSDLRSLWDEFEEQATPEAQYASAMDRLQPILQNLNSQGNAWQQHSIRREQVLSRNRHIGEASQSLWDYVKRSVTEATDKGWLID
ncbi:MAG: HD domain-containing protein [bacterium]|nr:HD domain-containing protein [bacterium]